MQEEVYPLIICHVYGYLWTRPFPLCFCGDDVICLTRWYALRELTGMIGDHLPMPLLVSCLADRYFYPEHGTVAFVQNRAEQQGIWFGFLVGCVWIVVGEQLRGREGGEQNQHEDACCAIFSRSHRLRFLLPLPPLLPPHPRRDSTQADWWSRFQNRCRIRDRRRSRLRRRPLPRYRDRFRIPDTQP